jgi:hypothetical protein
MPIFNFARAMPTVRTNNPKRCFSAAKTCSMTELNHDRHSEGRFLEPSDRLTTNFLAAVCIAAIVSYWL